MRIFFDMDGTLAEWKPIVVKTDEAASKVVDEVLNQPYYYYNLKPYQNIVNLAKSLIEQGYDVYTLSCYREATKTSNPLRDKNLWLNEYLPEIDCEHRIFVSDGQNKAEHIKTLMGESLTTSDILIDDYNKNLDEWKAAGGYSVKCLNGINSPSTQHLHHITASTTRSSFLKALDLDKTANQGDQDYARD